ncbi:hypothetical protein [Desulfoluna spongiiphila]|uniref:hypothetical protein n=1 Tax=Desulfoluna spongiiphila TaxID=419481 RepID=UPI00125227ED|nr:hypothetical protein [Desulfoluna spongiiphila]VVS95704.1 hypothetical protein DBB_52810 [Desulfoluna spongiiphila]
MTFDDKSKCSEIWAMVSGIETNPEEWCVEAGDALSEMIAEMRGCSKAMRYVPSPSGSRPGYGWLVNYVYDVLKQRYGMNRARIFQSCLNVGLSKWKTHITCVMSECY